MARIRDYGRSPGTLPCGPMNAITDVQGVLVGHVTKISGGDVRTGVTAILPHDGNLYFERVPAGIAIANGHGKMAGATQVKELGELETPIVLVNTLSVGRAMEAVVDWTLQQPGCEKVCSVNPFIGETNDSPLNNIRQRGIEASDVLSAIETATTGPVEMGAVGAGTGTMAFGLKAGIGSSSRVVSIGEEYFTIGALVQANFGGFLTMDGVRIGKADTSDAREETNENDGSIVIVLATDAPLSDRNLERLAKRAFAGLAVTGSSFENGSGDYSIAFSVHPNCRRQFGEKEPRLLMELPNNSISPLFRAAIEATEEAIYDSLLAAQSMTSFDTVQQCDVCARSIADRVDTFLSEDDI